MSDETAGGSNAPVAQWLRRDIPNVEIAGSSPAGSWEHFFSHRDRTLIPWQCVLFECTIVYTGVIND
jgi:hypothetical protein